MNKPFWKQEKLRASEAEILLMKSSRTVKTGWFRRLPIIRHFLALKLMKQINNHYDFWVSIGSLPVNAESDYKVARAIWDGRL